MRLRTALSKGVRGKSLHHEGMAASLEAVPRALRGISNARPESDLFLLFSWIFRGSPGRPGPRDPQNRDQREKSHPVVLC